MALVGVLYIGSPGYSLEFTKSIDLKLQNAWLSAIYKKQQS